MVGKARYRMEQATTLTWVAPLAPRKVSLFKLVLVLV